ncbi:glycosyltransferase [Patescibacteria group bacterium]|nr:MAG: glycosyltransferase [Patescibacteria group bacterium]
MQQKQTPDTILILSSNFGQGHMATARALKSAAEKHHDLNFNIEVVDFSDEVSSIFNTASKRIYEINAKHTPLIHKWIYTSTDKNHLPIRFINALNYPIRRKALIGIIAAHNPALIISNYPIWQYIAYSITKEYFDVEFATLITDSITVHSAWAQPDSDFYLVANEPTAASLHKLGVANKKIFPLGYPVHESFTQPVNTSVLKELDIPSTDQIVTISASSLRAGYVKRMVKQLALIDKTTFILIDGRDEVLLESLRADSYELPENFRLIGWTDKMPEYIKNAALIITKAGGSTVMECIAAKKPMIINKVIPGQEEGNAELVDRFKLGIVAEKPRDIAQAVRQILSQQEDYAPRLAKFAQPDASLHILQYLRERLNTRKQ